jgi:lipopolysaccharide transport system permease protein
LLWVVACQLLFTIGLVAIVSALGVFVRDVQPIMGTVIFVWFFLTPIVYPSSMLPSAVRRWMMVNPMCVFVELYRDIVLLNHVAPVLHLWVAMLAGVTFLTGGWIFLRMKPAFADVL